MIATPPLPELSERVDISCHQAHPVQAVRRGTRPLSDEEIARTALCLKATAHSKRLAILWLLMDGPLSVGTIREALGTSQPNISQHLHSLAIRRLVVAEKNANRVYYAIGDPRLHAFLGRLREAYCS
jgi:ArsR family transcriptional regulator